MDKEIIPKSLAKSACQKHIRRGNVEEALRCAKVNIEQDALDFSRRVMVLAPEEVSIHPLMVDVVEINKRLSKKGEVASDHDKDVMLTIVRDIAKAKTRDTWEYDGMKGKLRFDFVITKEMFDYFTKWQQDILSALKYRASIGGMKGDLLMFQHMQPYLAQKWATGEKYTYDMFYDNLDEPLVNNKEIGQVTPSDIPYYAVDIHCFPPIAKMCLQRAYWEYGEKKYRDTEIKKYAESIRDKMDKFVPLGNGECKPEDFCREFVRRIIWTCEAAYNDKKDYKTGEPLDLLRWEGFSENDNQIILEGHKILTPIWKSGAEWYINKCFERE